MRLPRVGGSTSKTNPEMLDCGPAMLSGREEEECTFNRESDRGHCRQRKSALTYPTCALAHDAKGNWRVDYRTPSLSAEIGKVEQ